MGLVELFCSVTGRTLIKPFERSLSEFAFPFSSKVFDQSRKTTNIVHKLFTFLNLLLGKFKGYENDAQII